MRTWRVQKKNINSMDEKEIFERNADPDFLKYVQYIVDNDVLTKAERGISARMLDKGYDTLSEKQQYVFDRMIEEHSITECIHCGQSIPWVEMMAARENGGMCSWCQRQWEKIQRD